MTTRTSTKTPPNITVDGNPVPVESLSEDTQKAVATLARYYNEYIELQYELEKAITLVNAKKAEVEALVKRELHQGNTVPPSEDN